MKHAYDRSAIMKDAWRLIRLGMDRPSAMKAAWATARSGRLADAARNEHPTGVRAALRRYGIDADALAMRAQAAVQAIVAAIATDRPALLPPPSVKAIDLKRGEDGVYRI